jgi:hypothetical protein
MRGAKRNWQRGLTAEVDWGILNARIHMDNVVVVNNVFGIASALIVIDAKVTSIRTVSAAFISLLGKEGFVSSPVV